jgi:hypothetical protein
MKHKVNTKKKIVKELVLNSLFSNSGTLTDNEINSLPTIRWTMGKFRVDAKFEAENTNGVPVWYTMQSDSNGKYKALWCFKSWDLSPYQQKIYDRVISIFNH